MALFRALALVGVTSCHFSPPAVSGGGDGADGADGETGEADAAGDAACQPTCSDEHTVVPCAGNAEVTCAFACVEGDAGAACAEVSNGADPATYLEAGLVDVILDDDFLVDSGTGRIAAGSNVLRDTGPGLVDGVGFHVLGGGAALFTMGRLEVASGRRIRFTGDRPIILLAAGEVIVRGRLDLSGVSCAGVCGESDCGVGGQGLSGSGGSGRETGGGGGGMGQAGAPGGAAGTSRGGLGGALGGCPGPSLIPLDGGSGGGTGGEGGSGGQGGGALQLTSLLAIAITGDTASTGIDASGEGGFGGVTGGGGGGGSGGAILLEAPRVTLENATIAANGGGGGAGGGSSPGENGAFGAEPAAGGSSGSAGGAGGALGAEPEKGMDASNNTGGGGGGAGIIRIIAATFHEAGAIISPAPSLP